MEDVNKTIKSLHHWKASGTDSIPPKLLKIEANAIDSHMANIFNHGLLNKWFAEKAKTANIHKIYKKELREELKKLKTCFIHISIGAYVEII